MLKKLKINSGDIFGGFAAMLVALPSAIAFGIIIFSPLGQDYLSRGAIAGIIGTIFIGILAPLFGGSQKLISAPCAPAAAVLSAFVIEMSGSLNHGMIPSLILLIVFFAGVFQVLIGVLGVGRFIKYIPYPVVAGYLSAVGLLIITGQVSKFLGTEKGVSIFQALIHPGLWVWKGLFVGIISMTAMILSLRFVKKIPSTIISVLSGVGGYWLLSLFYPEMKSLEANHLVVGPITGSLDSVIGSISETWSSLVGFDAGLAGKVAVSAVTLSVLLSIDTLKTCLVVDAMTRSRHNSNRELFGQGISNIASGLFCGIAGAGTMGATLVNIGSGGKTKFSGLLEGGSSLIVFLFLAPLIAWVPIPTLAAILIVIGIRMIDLKTFSLLKHRSTVFDFTVYLMVVLTALFLNLIAAAVAGILLSIFIFLRNEVRQSVIRRKAFGDQIFSKKRRLPEERDILNREGNQTLVLELQGPLFFGTADQLLSELEPYLSKIKYLILDMRRVHSLDYTAAQRLKQIEQTMRDKKGMLILTSVPIYVPMGQNIQDYLERLGFTKDEKNIRFFNDVNAGIQWAEDRILECADFSCKENSRLLELPDFHIFSDLGSQMIQALASCVSEKKYNPGEIIFSRGDQGNELFLIRKGTVQIYLPISEEKTEHLTTFCKGDYFGDMSFLSSEVRSANAVAEDEVSLYIIKRTSFDEISRENCEISSKFFARLAIDLTERLRQNHIMLKTLAE